MTQEEKKLLLKDLCGRLPYGVNLHIEFYDLQGDGKLASRDIKLTPSNITYCFDNSHWVSVKPYLRPMSSMTEEEATEWAEVSNMKFDMEDGFFDAYDDASLSVDWLDENMFDHRGLIKWELAHEAPEGMYKTK